MEVFEQKNVEIDGNKFLIRAFDAIYGLQVMTKLQETLFQGFAAPPDLVVEVVMKSVTLNGFKIDDKKFSLVFSKKYKMLMELFSEIIRFNYGDLLETEEEDSPNEESGTIEN